jgi:hypothetical protein
VTGCPIKAEAARQLAVDLGLDGPFIGEAGRPTGGEHRLGTLNGMVEDGSVGSGRDWCGAGRSDLDAEVLRFVFEVGHGSG